MLSNESMDSFAASFAARVNGEGCACILFPEVTENDQTSLVILAAMESVEEAFMVSGDLEVTRKAAHHALIVMMAFGLAYGRLDSLPTDGADYSWGLSDKQLESLAGEDFLPES